MVQSWFEVSDLELQKLDRAFFSAIFDVVNLQARKQMVPIES
jgi:hypothetical protein